MDNNDSESKSRKEDRLRVEILSDALEKYKTMATVFFRRLEHDEKIDAMIEVAEILKEERSVE